MILLAARGARRSAAGSYAGLRRWPRTEQQRLFADKGDSDGESSLLSNVYNKLKCVHGPQHATLLCLA